MPSIKGTSIYNRPIIGILSQEIHESLTDDLAELMNNEHNVEFINVNRERAMTMDRFEYRKRAPQDNPEEIETARPELRTASTEFKASTQMTLNEGDSFSTPSIAGSFEEALTSAQDAIVSKNATYIGASYVKFVEAAGARVVPIFINKDKEYYEHILESVNGVLFPGGAVAINDASGYGRAGKIIYEIAREMNHRGDVFPLWGTCLGFELMMGLAANGNEIRTSCDAQNKADYLKLDTHYADGYLLRHLPKKLLKAITTEPITSNFHKFCVTPKNFTAFGVDKFYRALAFSADRRGVEYVAAAEAWEYPFFAVQFHPEKTPYEWTTKSGHDHIPHSSAAVNLANYFAQVFVNYARRNNHKFSDASEETRSLIYNFSPIYTGQYSPMEQIYIF
ncbi:hypothetical protein SK128_001886 [Halocaridina rubra]|uniref:folate gamma-glutamyl hydrolase n=1 Tax=Halocaridina rubra TaxID=373956 RepID=A0AAN8WIP2_HALRR